MNPLPFQAKWVSALRWVLLIVLAFLAWRSINYMSGNEPGPDSSIFMSMAWHADEGRVLYKEVWDHKPPMIFVLDGMALALGGRSVNAVRTMERVFAILGVAALFGVVYVAFRRFWLAYLASILYLFHFYWIYVFEDGNVTEEYGAVLSLVGMIAVAASPRSPRRRSLILSGIAGMAFSAAILCKEPFLLMVPPWFLYTAWRHEGTWRDARSRAGAFLCGAVLPGLVFVGYLVMAGAWADWVDVVAFDLSNKAGAIPPGSESFVGRMLSMANAKVLGALVTTRVAALLGIAGAFHVSFGRRTRGLPLVIATSAVLSLLATSLGGGYSGHYYMFFVPSYVLLGASGIAFLVDLAPPNRRVVALAAVLGPLLLMDSAALTAFAGRLAEPARRWHGHSLADVLRKNTAPGDLIWAPWAPLLYVETGRLSPTKWFFAFNHLFVDTPASTVAQKFQTLRNDLQQHPPRVIVLNAPPGLWLTRANADEFLTKSGLTDWIAANYWTALGSANDPFQVMVSKGPLTDPATRSHTSASDAMASGLNALYKEADPFKAVFQFHRVLDETPAHYGATYQLAKALDAAGQFTEARRTWKNMYALARDARDTTSLNVVRYRLATADAETPLAQMTAGLDCLYLLGDGAAASQHFRKVLATDPSHYGANLQLAKSLDLAGKRDEARLQWQVVLRLAEVARDTATAAAARARLQALS